MKSRQAGNDMEHPGSLNMEPETQSLEKGDSELGNHHFQVPCFELLGGVKT